MNDDKHSHGAFEQYIRQGEPEQVERAGCWQTAIGLQDVDGLKTSAYLQETAQAHIEGNIDIGEARRRIESYYEVREERLKDDAANTAEADIVSARITEILGERSFKFAPVTLFSIHRRLFDGLWEHAGKVRTYNITKKEWVLYGESVYYASAQSIMETLDYDFEQESAFSYQDLSMQAIIRHIAKFTSGIWQIHPFCEGNTRTTAVFMIMYLRTLGFALQNDVFAENSWYFRNALVRANYNQIRQGIRATTKYLELFYENQLLGAKHELKNRDLCIEFCDSHMESRDIQNG
ncbi:MAG: Fic family protein [Proteobacteria bacterium]|nr:Fic family protein [Pseudomonadota bacterium]